MLKKKLKDHNGPTMQSLLNVPMASSWAALFCLFFPFISFPCRYFPNTDERWNLTSVFPHPHSQLCHFPSLLLQLSSTLSSTQSPPDGSVGSEFTCPHRQPSVDSQGHPACPTQSHKQSEIATKGLKFVKCWLFSPFLLASGQVKRLLTLGFSKWKHGGHSSHSQEKMHYFSIV